MNQAQPEPRTGARLDFWLFAALISCGQAPPVPAIGPIAVVPPTAVVESEAGFFPLATSPDAGVDAGPDPFAALSAAAPLEGSEDAGVAVEGQAASENEENAEATEAPLASSACPAGMILVDTTYCPRVERRCVDEEYSPQNHFTICHKFAPTQRCLVSEEHRRFCIDEYEYPNQKGAHPPWMVSWYDAEASCRALGKRTCFESEWVSACEGPDKTPFPYGLERDNSKCNIDNTWIHPHLADLYDKNEAARDKELARLDQSMRSGAIEACVSGFGVHDLTGNFDEWVTADHNYDDQSDWAALKGGAWGHVRNACRPTTTSHPPDFTYYFIAFRCCKDAADGEPYAPKVAVPKIEPKDRAPIPDPVDAPGPSTTKVAREHWPKPVAGR